MTEAEAGWVGAIVGSALGIAGAAIGVWASVRAAKSPAEKRLMLRWGLGFSAFALVFCAAVILIESPWKWALWAVYGPLLAFAIVRCNRAQARIRAENTASPAS